MRYVIMRWNFLRYKGLVTYQNRLYFIEASLLIFIFPFFLVYHYYRMIIILLLELVRTITWRSMSVLFNNYCRRGSLPIPNRGNKHFTNCQKRAFLIPLDTVPVSPSSQQEDTQCKYHQNAGDSESKTPAKVVLDVT